MDTRTTHWREYATEAACLGLFMASAASFATLLRHPLSPLSSIVGSAAWPFVGRMPMGVAMGLTAAAIIYSPLGQRSGAHMNPAVTLTFLRLGKVAAHDAVGYVAAQFMGGAAGILAVTWILRGLPGDPSVNYVATIEDPLSGMSMNPARTLGPALLAHTGHSLWIYFTAPPLGMLVAAELFIRTHGRRGVRCAKLHHPADGPCIFRCGYMEIPA
jgi:aquaporin Z